MNTPHPLPAGYRRETEPLGVKVPEHVLSSLAVLDIARLYRESREEALKLADESCDEFKRSSK